jgi:hypothetical protein
VAGLRWLLLALAGSTGYTLSFDIVDFLLTFMNA